MKHFTTAQEIARQARNLGFRPQVQQYSCFLPLDGVKRAQINAINAYLNRYDNVRARYTRDYYLIYIDMPAREFGREKYKQSNLFTLSAFLVFSKCGEYMHTNEGVYYNTRNGFIRELLNY